MEMRFDHLGVVVKSLDRGRKLVSDILNITGWTETFRDPVNGVAIQFGLDETGTCYELLEPLDSSSPVFPALKTQKAILNHVAYRVTDLSEAAARLARADCVPTSEPKPAIAYGGRRIQFFVTPLHFVVELVEAWQHRHEYFETQENRGNPG